MVALWWRAGGARALTCCVAGPWLSCVQSNAHVPKIVSIAVTVLGNGTRLVAGDVGLRLAQVLAGLQPPAELVQAELAKLKERQRNNFQSYMAGTVPPTADD